MPIRTEQPQSITGSRIKADRVTASRQDSVLDTGAISQEIAKQIVVLPNGEVFDLSVGGVTFISKIKDRAAIATPQAGWAAEAAANLRRERLVKIASGKLQELRKKAHIEYAPAYRPKDAPTGK